MKEKSLIEEIKIQKLLSHYKKLEPLIDSCQTHEESASIIRDNENSLSIIFKMILSEVVAGNFLMHYQPQVANGKCMSAEALFRCSIENSFINPQVVFSLADYFNLESKLNEEILNRICQDTKLFTQQINPNFQVSYNVSPKQFTPKFVKNFYSTLENNNISPSNIGIELLESSSFDGLYHNLIQNCINKGTSIYLDDYGTGYASKNTTKQIPLTHLKFAGELVSNIQSNPQNQETISSALEICKQKNIIPVFERVESQEEFSTLMTLSSGQGMIQGYFYSKPLETSELISFVNGINQTPDQNKIDDLTPDEN